MTTPLAPVYPNNEPLPYASPFILQQERDTASPDKDIHMPELPLPKVVRMRDLVALCIFTLVFVANASGVQFGGPAAFTYWAIGLLTFLLPIAYVTNWLARHFPGAEGPYRWVTVVLGEKWGFISTFCIWLAGMLGTVAAVDACILLLENTHPRIVNSPLTDALAIVVVLALATLLALLPLRWLRHVFVVVALIYLSVSLLLGFAGIWWLRMGHHAAIAFMSLQAWMPAKANFGVGGIVVLALLGVDIPMILSGELRTKTGRTRSAGRYVWWGAALSFVAYIAQTFGIMVVVPSALAGGNSAAILTMNSVFGPLSGTLINSTFVLCYLLIITTYLFLFARFLVVLAHHQRLPIQLTRLNQHGVPVLSIVAQCVFVLLNALLAYVVVPDFLAVFAHITNVDSALYNVIQAVVSVLWTGYSVQLMFLPYWAVHRRKMRDPITRTQRLFLGGIVVIGGIAALIGMWETLFNSWIPAQLPNQTWFFLIVGITLLSLLAAWIGSELPRMYALLHVQRSLHQQEMGLRSELQDAYHEQEVLVLQQKELLNELDRLYREQQLAAVTDAVTGLPNHRAIMSRLDEELARCERIREGKKEGLFDGCAVLFVDLDHFKRINDTWGHRAGDAILREVASRLRSVLRLEDFVGRYGGEEFAIILIETEISQAMQIAERLRLAIADKACIWQSEDGESNTPIAVTASMGVALYGLHGVTREELIERADAAMYIAKHSGRNRVSIADLTEGVAVEEAQSRAAEIPVGRVVTATVNALTAAASAHDGDTDAHAHRMVWLAEETARAMNLSEDEIHLVRLGALLHDIGKIGIPDAILHKPGPLTSDEWSVMRRHPEIGQYILQQAGGIFAALANVVVAHHERWDGAGYPIGIKGYEIPRPARILTVIDSFDAMISPRVYKKPLSVQAARSELLRCAGSQYDPEVVTVFLQVLDGIEQVAQEKLLPHIVDSSAAMEHELGKS